MTEPITCCIKYRIAPESLREFEHYARVWKDIIERLGGSYQGCFIPGNEPPDASYFSFPEIGQKGPENTATVIFSFRDLDAYERYRREASNDPECEGVTDFLKETKCFTSYERTFVKKIDL